MPRIFWLVTVASAVCGLAAVVGGLLLIPELLYPRLTDIDLRSVSGAETRIQLQQNQGQLQNTVRSTLLQAVAGLLVVIGAAATWCQVRINRDGQFTDRFTRGVEQLGSDNIDIRVGGIYALERIAHNSPEDRRTIQVVLGNYVRNRSPWFVGSQDGPEHPTPTVDEHWPWLRLKAPDIQAAMIVLARRPNSRNAPRLYLSRVDLRSLQLENNRLPHIHMRHANLARAWLPGTQLDGSDLNDTDLRQANLENASLRGTSLRHAYLEGANLRGADLRNADLRGADMRARHLEEADLTGAITDATTTWPSTFGPDYRQTQGIVEPEPGV